MAQEKEWMELAVNGNWESVIFRLVDYYLGVYSFALALICCLVDSKLSTLKSTKGSTVLISQAVP
jgi:hypothetical protein